MKTTYFCSRISLYILKWNCVKWGSYTNPLFAKIISDHSTNHSSFWLMFYTRHKVNNKRKLLILFIHLHKKSYRITYWIFSILSDNLRCAKYHILVFIDYTHPKNLVSLLLTYVCDLFLLFHLRIPDFDLLGIQRKAGLLHNIATLNSTCLSLEMVFLWKDVGCKRYL